MAKQVFQLPDIGEGVTEAEIVAWHVKVGDRVAEDQSLVDVMTDKATVDISSPFAGVVTAVHGAVGQLAAVGAVLAEFEVEDAGGTQPPLPRPPAASPPTVPPQASPAVRKRAEALGLRLEDVVGTGPSGRITDADLDAFAAGGGSPAPSGVEAVRIVGLRRKIAEKMQQSKQRIPHFGYVEEFDLTDLEVLRERLNAQRREDQPKLTLLPFFLRALAKTLPDFRDVNARYDDEAQVLHRHDAIHVGVATQTAGGLMVPVVRDAQTRDLWSLAAEIARVAQGARDGTATREELTGSTITVTSLGPLGGVSATPIINHPEVAIIGPNKLQDRAVVRGGKVEVRRMMNVSSAFDHRIVDGYEAARFIQAVKALIEQPDRLLAD